MNTRPTTILSLPERVQLRLRLVEELHRTLEERDERTRGYDRNEIELFENIIRVLDLDAREAASVLQMRAECQHLLEVAQHALSLVDRMRPPTVMLSMTGPAPREIRIGDLVYIPRDPPEPDAESPAEPDTHIPLKDA